ncbi:uncharacterized protein LOC141618130 [Silene latifolia]|uniref:uncharacterized protein LOC141618130 n=1 Tax=Silene latifolia TaxID=37657 RepID=UPI003D787B5E
MELKEKKKLGRGIMRKTWERCKSFNQGPLSSPSSAPHAILHRSTSHLMVKSKSWSSFFPSTPTTPRTGKWAGGSNKPNKVGLSTPKGYLSIYVGIEKQRFVIKIEYTNHPLFKMLLEEAELEYGFHNDGPLVLPCDDTFVKVLFEIEEGDRMITHAGCSPMSRRHSYRLLSPSTSFVSFVQTTTSEP